MIKTTIFGALGITLILVYQNCGQRDAEDKAQGTNSPNTSPVVGYKMTPTAFIALDGQPTATIQNPGCTTTNPSDRDCVATILGRLTNNNQPVRNASISVCIKPPGGSYTSGGCALVSTDTDGNILSNQGTGPWSVAFCTSTTALDVGVFSGSVSGGTLTQSPLLERRNVLTCTP